MRAISSAEFFKCVRLFLSSNDRKQMQLSATVNDIRATCGAPPPISTRRERTMRRGWFIHSDEKNAFSPESSRSLPTAAANPSSSCRCLRAKLRHQQSRQRDPPPARAAGIDLRASGSAVAGAIVLPTLRGARSVGSAVVAPLESAPRHLSRRGAAQAPRSPGPRYPGPTWGTRRIGRTAQGQMPGRATGTRGAWAAPRRDARARDRVACAVTRSPAGRL